MSESPASIGRYKVVDRIGQGGMGLLYLAFDPMLERQVAIKLLRDDNEELRERFSREARAVARLRHPHIVTIFDVGEQDGNPFIAMEYLHGQTLADVIRGAQPIDVSRKLQMIDELCDGLNYAHKAGIVHRDVKPANVMVEQDGAVKVLDFGIARIAESGMTQAGMLIGTLNYMSPEQVAGTVVDGRSDIFAVGAVLYELLAYRQAFPGGLHTGILNKILHVQPTPLDAVCPGLDSEVIAIVDRALQKEPEKRYQDLQAMRKDLQRVKHRLEQDLGTVIIRPEDAVDRGDTESPTAPTRRPHTPRVFSDRDELAKRRATQTAAHLEQARRAMDTNDFDAAVAAAEQALLLNAEEPEAQRILDRVRQALDERQLKEWLARGAELLKKGQHTEALGLAEQALTLAPGSAEALELRRAVEEARAARNEARRRQEGAHAAMVRARDFFEKQAYDDALRAADDALALTPDSSDAVALRGRALDAQARQRQAAKDAQVTNALARATALFSNGKHEDAVAVLETCGVDDARISKTLEDMRSRMAQLAQEAARQAQEREEREQRDRTIARAIERAGSETSHELALTILSEAHALDRNRADVGGLIESRQAALTVEREEARRAAERQQKIAAALAEAKKTKSHEAAAAILRQAVAIDPSHAEAKRALEQRVEALEREQEEARRKAAEERERQLRERQEKIAAALAEAAATPGHDAAIAILERAAALDPKNAGIRQAIETRQKARAETLEREQEEARRKAAEERERQLREQQEKIAAALAEAAATPAHDAAIAILERATALDPKNGEIRQAIEARQKARAEAEEREQEEARRKAAEERERQLRERQKKVAAALAEAAATPAHDAAIGILERATATDPQNAEIRQAIDARRTALNREQEEKRRAREREERIASALAAAEKAPAHETAVALLKEALALDPSNAQVRSRLDARQAALDEQREQARREAERAARIADAIKQAKRAKSHEEAITLLNQALALDASNREARSLLESRTRSLEAERAEADRARRIEAARQSIAALIQRQDFDGAEAALKEADALQAPKALKDLRRQLRDARQTAAAAGRAATSKAAGAGATRPGGLTPATMAAAAAVAIAVGVGGYFVMHKSTPSPAPTVQPPPTAWAATPAAGTPPVNSERSAPPGPATATSPPPAPPVAATPSTDPAAALKARSAAAVQLGRQRLAAKDLRQAWAVTAAALSADASNRELDRLASDIVSTARQQAVASRTAAAGRGNAATESTPYKNAQGRENEGVRQQRARRNEPAMRAFLEAVDLYGQADREAQQRADAVRAEPPRPTPADPSPASGGRSNPPSPERAPTPVENPSAPASPPAAPATPPAGTATAPLTARPSPSAPAAPVVVDERPMIHATLNAYVGAYANLDAAAVARVYPSITVEALRRSFADYKSFQLQIEQEQIVVSGAEATVTCRLRTTYVPKAGNPHSDSRSTTFKLKKTGSQWIIASRQ